MARDDELKFAGEFRIDDCTIITHEGFEYNVNQLVEAVNFYEDIYSATVSGSIILKDIPRGGIKILGKKDIERLFA